MNHLKKIVEFNVSIAEILKKNSSHIFQWKPGGPSYNSKQNIPSHLFAFLFTRKVDGNSLYQSEWCAELSMNMIDNWVSPYFESKKKNEPDFTSEWPILIIPMVIELLGEDLPKEKRDHWFSFLEDYCIWASQKPLGLSAPNHEIWRCFGIYKVGLMQNNIQFQKTGLMLAEQMMEYQSPLGYWEEGPHHGPSMYFNFRLIIALAYMYRTSKNQKILESLKKLVKFMTSYSYPDGTTVGAFDGRQPTHFGDHSPIIAGYELLAEGQKLNANSLKNWLETKDFNDTNNEVAYYKEYNIPAGFGSLSLQYYVDFLNDEEKETCCDDKGKLEIERSSNIISNEVNFKSAMYRKNGFVSAISANESQIPKLVKSPFRLDRQSRIEVWHEKNRLIIGGGNNRRDYDIPYANVIMDTGFFGETDFGLVNQSLVDKRRNYYISKANTIDTALDYPNLKVNFGHGYVNFNIDILDDTDFKIKIDFTTESLKKLCVQIPFIIYKNSVTKIDDDRIDSHKTHNTIEKVLSVCGAPQF